MPYTLLGDSEPEPEPNFLSMKSSLYALHFPLHFFRTKPTKRRRIKEDRRNTTKPTERSRKMKTGTRAVWPTVLQQVQQQSTQNEVEDV